MAADENHLRVIREEHIEDMPKLRQRASDPSRDRSGGSTFSLAGSIRNLALISYLLDRDPSQFRAQMSECVSLKLALFTRHDAGDEIDGSYISMDAYTELLDALATGDESLAKTFASLMGGRPEAEEEFDSPFSSAIGYALKYAVAEDAGSAAPHVKALEALCHEDEFSTFLGYPLMIQALFDRDLAAMRAGVAELLRGHERLSQPGEELYETLDDDLYVWGVGMLNLARLRGLEVEGDGRRIPANLLMPVRVS